MIGLTSSGIARIPFRDDFLGQPSRLLRRFANTSTIDAVAGWGLKPSGQRAVALAQQLGIPALLLEDGFLRSFGFGPHSPPLSLVVDEQGIYYDSTRASALETLLCSSIDVLDGIAADVGRARELVLRHRLSKYNSAPDWNPASHPLPDPLPPAGEGAVRRVLVIDQTFGDLGIEFGAASADTFTAMLAAARAENPAATIYVKTHPEVISGRKRGHLSQLRDDERTVVLRDSINPLSLVEQMDRVYVVTSTLGFEALLAGKPVSCFGLPWYAGWGATDDRQRCPRRTRTRSVDELFAAAYFHYTRYLNPVTQQRGTIFDVIEWLVRQREISAATGKRHLIGVGFRRWKMANVKPLLSLDPAQVVFVGSARTARKLTPTPADRLIFWGRDAPSGLPELSRHSGAPTLHLEDGFIRSVGLGSDLIRPLSLVLDGRGIYFDPTQASDLEHILNTADFSADELATARRVREFIVRHGITKYNLEPRQPVAWPSAGKRVVLVPGQVEDDASIRYGCTSITTNRGLLQAVRSALPDAYIVYKPHPDVLSGNRAGKLSGDSIRRYADHVETRLSVVSCIEACDELHTMTSLAGFDALLRGKIVVTYGQPFYAGWGLTHAVVTDGVAYARRARILQLDELVAGTLLRYPLYWDWDLRGYTSCEAVLQRIVTTRDALERSGDLEKLRVGFVRRQLRKLAILGRAWTGRF